MSSVLNVRDKVHIVTRRSFPQEVRRHFVGEIVAATDSAIRAEGYVFIFDEGRNAFSRKVERRTRIFGFTASDFIINVIPTTTDLEAVTYRVNEQGSTVCTDGKNFSLDVNEFTFAR